MHDAHLVGVVQRLREAYRVEGEVTEAAFDGAAAPDEVKPEGVGEEIIRHAMARLVYERMAAGDTAREAVIRGCEVFGEEWSLGLIAVGPVDWAVAANREMAWGQAAP